MNLTCATNSAINGEYYYIRNAQGDIIGLIDKNGTQVVAYTYDSWGKPFTTAEEKASSTDTVDDGITGSLASTVGVKNPYRYRGYRYDTEMGMYYLQSRYYNPEFGRFINADALGGQVGSLLSHNLFAYCQNEPINHADPSGFSRILVMDDAGNFSNGWNEYSTGDGYKTYSQSKDFSDISFSRGPTGVEGKLESHTPYYGTSNYLGKSISKYAAIDGQLYLSSSLQAGPSLQMDKDWKQYTLGVSVTPGSVGARGKSNIWFLHAEGEIAASAGYGFGGSFGMTDGKNGKYGLSLGGLLANAVGLKVDLKVWIDVNEIFR